MTAQQDAYREFRDKLHARRKELRSAAQAGLRAMGEEKYAREVGDLEDAALADWMDSLQVADLRHDVAELNDIEEALQRLAAESYGSCIDCHDEIPAPRLRAHPTAKRCLACQEIYERRRRHCA